MIAEAFAPVVHAAKAMKSVPTNGNGSSMGAKARRVLLFDRAREALTARRLADAMGITRRAVNHKIAVDRGLTDVDLLEAANALDARAAELAALAGDIREVLR